MNMNEQDDNATNDTSELLPGAWLSDEMVHVPFIAGRVIDELIDNIDLEEREGIGRKKSNLLYADP